MSKKTDPWLYDKPYIFISALKSGTKSLSDIAEIFGMSSQNMRPWLLMLVNEGLVEQPKVGLYKLSSAGRNIFDMPYKVKRLEEKIERLEEFYPQNTAQLHNQINPMGMFF